MTDLQNALFGAIVGDAVGVPYEFTKRDTFTCTEMTEGGVWQQPLGSWSDDSSLILATIDSCITSKTICQKDLLYHFCLWFYQNWYTPFDVCFDSGETCTRAIEKFYNGTPANECGGTDKMDNGNGALMRIIPLAFTNASDDKIKEVAGVTHNHDISHQCCVTYIKIARELLIDKNFDKSEKFKEYINNNPYIRDITILNREDINSGGYVVDTLEASLWCLINSNSYKDCVLKAINLGRDTDTTACVAGALAGIKFGDIPDEWINNLPQLNYLNTLINQFDEIRNFL